MNAEVTIRVTNQEEFQRKLQQESSGNSLLNSGAQIVEAIPGLGAFWSEQQPPLEFKVGVSATTSLRDLHCEIWSKMKLAPCTSIKLTITNAVNKTTLTTRLDENLAEHLSTKIMDSGLLSSELLLLVDAEECENEVTIFGDPAVGNNQPIENPLGDTAPRSKNLMDLILPPTNITGSDRPALFAGLKSPVSSPSPNPSRKQSASASENKPVGLTLSLCPNLKETPNAE
jgi:hypothetical protein